MMEILQMAALLTAFSVRMEVAASLTLNPIKDAAKVQGPVNRLQG
jgi:hypothetical protein